MKIEIISPEEIIYTGDVKLVSLPGAKGAFEILNNHAPIISSLVKGTIRVVEKDDSQKTFEINSGMIQTNKNVVNILIN